MEGPIAKGLVARQAGGFSGFGLKCLASALLFFLVVVLSGCHTYPISKNIRQQAQPITLSQVKANPEGTRGKIVIWGGQIINVVNETHGSSIYIIALPLNKHGKPIPHKVSPGRFIATTTEFVDPEMFPQHGLITVAGGLNGVWTERLGNIPYPYPVVEIQETHVWPPEQADYYPDYGYGYGYGYPYGYDYPYWGWDWGPGWWWWDGGVFVFHGRGFHDHGFHDHGGFHGRGG